jgi:photosystem II stability/assembly factor-like uncharacterized protein
MKSKYLTTIIVVEVILIRAVYLTQKNNKVPTQVSSEKQEEIIAENPIYGHIHSLFRNPTNKTILMGTHNGIFKSIDEGKTFTKVETQSEVMAEDFMNFAFDQNTNTIYAGGHDVGIVKSSDGGLTWSKADSGIKGTDIHALAINPLDTNRLYAFSVDNGVFGTKDGAQSWYRIDDGPTNPSVRAFGYMATPSSMDRSMRTDKTTNVGYLWAGTGGGLYSSFACFCGWTKTNGISDNATVYALAPDPVNRSRMLAGTKDGVWKTTDEGKTFTKVNANIVDIAAIAFDLSDPKVVFSATNGGTLYKSTDTGETWNKIQ